MTTQQKLIQYINNQRIFIKSLDEFKNSPVFISKAKLINQKLYEKIPLMNNLIEQNTSHLYAPMDSKIIKRLMTMSRIWTRRMISKQKYYQKWSEILIYNPLYKDSSNTSIIKRNSSNL